VHLHSIARWLGRSGAFALGDIGIGRNSIDVQLRNLTVDGASGFGIFVFGAARCHSRM